MVVPLDRYTKLAKGVPTTKTRTITDACIFSEHWVSNYGIPSKLLANNGPQFVSKIFVAVCSILKGNNITTAEYHPQSNGQAERFYSTLISRLCHYLSENQTDWGTYLLLLTYTYNVQVHNSINESRFSLTLTKTCSGPATVVPKRISLS